MIGNIIYKHGPSSPTALRAGDVGIGDEVLVGAVSAKVTTLIEVRGTARTSSGTVYLLEVDGTGAWVCGGVLHVPATELDATEIHPGLWMGSKPPTGRVLADAGFDLVALCAREHQPDTRKFDDIEVLRTPFADGHRFMSGDLGLIVAAARRVADLVSNGDKVLVTCEMGQNRSALVGGIALHLATGWDGPKVLRTIRKARKGSLNNPLFVDCILGKHEPLVEVLFPV